MKIRDVIDLQRLAHNQGWILSRQRCGTYCVTRLTRRRGVQTVRLLGRTWREAADWLRKNPARAT